MDNKLNRSINSIFERQLNLESSLVITVSYFFGLLGLGISAFSAYKSGIAFDSGYELGVGNQSYQLSETYSLAAAYEFMPNASEYYGVFVQKSANFFNQFFTSDINLLNGLQQSAYMWQYFVVLLTLLIAIVALAKVIELYTSDVKVLHLVFLFFFTNPLVLGQLQINYKDAPVAFALLTYASGLVLFNVGMINKNSNNLLKFTKKSSPRFNLKGSENSQAAFGILFMIVGFSVAISCRAGAVALLAGLALSGVVSFLTTSLHKFGTLKPIFVLQFIFCHFLTILSSLIFLRSLNPLAKIDLQQWLIDSVVYASNNPASGLVRTAGIDVFNNPVPVWYVPAWIFVSIPILSILGLLFGCYYFFRYETLSKISNLFPLISLGILAPIGLMIMGVSLIDGIRQVLFIPIGFFAIGLLGLIIWSRLGQKPISVIVILGMALTSLVQTTPWIPYSYAFKNELSRFGKLQPAWENDYLGVSVREGVEKLRVTYNLPTVIVTPSNDMAHPWGDTPYVIEEDHLIKWPNDPFPDVFGVYIFHRYSWTDQTNFPIDSCYDFPLQPTCKNLKPYDCKVLFSIVHAGWEFGRGGICRKKI
jgi:hypothetical protein